MSAADIVNEILGSTWNLYHLLAMLDDHLLEAPHNDDMERVSAVVRIARDEAKAIALKCGGDAGQVAS